MSVYTPRRIDTPVGFTGQGGQPMITIAENQDALNVRNVVKRFHIQKPPIWERWFHRKKAASGSAVNGGNGASRSLREAPKRQVTAIDHVTLDVHRREIYGILGPNGSGKSTLVRLLSTLLIPDEGEVQVFGLDITRSEMAVKRLINRVSVDAAFFKKLSPMENLLYGARLYGLTGGVARVKAIEIMGRLGLEPNTYTQPMEEMSRGMQQKVAIARAFLTQPILLLLDEPTTGLDPRSKFEVQEFINELRDVHDATILITTHDMTEAERLCGRISILDEGRIVAEDTPEGLKALIRRNGHEPTLEDVFMELTGKKLMGQGDLEAEAEAEVEAA
jgi:ABC-2 type transport system ATP-binding protein